MVTLDDSERQVCEVYTRVMGYHRPVAYFNVGKQAEHRERKFCRTAETEAKLKEMAWNTIRE